MVASFDVVSRTARYTDKEVVVQQDSIGQTLSELAIMSGGTFERSFWTEILGEHNLESPGRAEAVKKTIEKIAYRKKLEEIKRNSKIKKKGKKK